MSREEVLSILNPCFKQGLGLSNSQGGQDIAMTTYHPGLTTGPGSFLIGHLGDPPAHSLLTLILTHTQHTGSRPRILAKRCLPLFAIVG